jgi:Lrp/AsnC family transcriptional regulator, leucine-responsive regulatory protein
MKSRTELKLDKLDLKILHELQANNTITYRALSDRVALSPSACVARVKQLEEAGIIQGYHASIAIARVRPTLVMMAEITLASHQVEDIDRFDKLLLGTREVVEVLRVNGPFDYIVRIMLASVEEWHGFAKRLLLPEYKVQKMVTHIVMQDLKPFNGYPVQVK